MTIPRIINTLPENHCQKLSGIVKKSVVAFIRSVNNITDTESERITVIDCLETFLLLPSDVPTITGRRGKTHGASIVSTPAKIEMERNIIL